MRIKLFGKTYKVVDKQRLERFCEIMDLIIGMPIAFVMLGMLWFLWAMMYANL